MPGATLAGRLSDGFGAELFPEPGVRGCILVGFAPARSFPLAIHSAICESDTVSRRIKLEEMLAAEPDDPFLNYALALETAKEDRVAALQRLAEMNDRFPDHVPAFFRRGQLLAESGDPEAARKVLVAGIQAARGVGDDHAAAEMQELLTSL